MFLQNLMNFCSNSTENQSSNTKNTEIGDEEDSTSEVGDEVSEVSEDLEGKSEDTGSRTAKRAACAIARDKAVRRKSAKVSNKEAAMQSAESLASAIRDMSNNQESRRTNEMMLWMEHEAKERAKDRELQKLQLEFKERESPRNYDLEMMRMRCYGGGTTQSAFPRQVQQFAPCASSTSVDQEFLDYNQGHISSDSSTTNS